MKKISVLLIAFITSMNVYSQTKNVLQKVEYLKGLQDRELIVVLKNPVEDSYAVKNLEKMIAKTKKEKKKIKLQKKLKNLKNFINYFNTEIKEIVPKYWTLNSKISYKTESEVIKLSKSKSKKYAILYFTNKRWSVGNSKYLFLPIFYYTGSESKLLFGSVSKSAYQNFLVNTNYNFSITKSSPELKILEDRLNAEKPKAERKFSKENMIVTMLLSQKHIKSILKNNKKSQFVDFVFEEAKNNCSKMKGKEVLIQEAIINKKILKTAPKYFTNGTLKTTTATQIADAIINEKDVIIGFPIVEKYLKGSGVAGPVTVTTARAFYHKLFINAKTGDVVGAIKGGMLTNDSSFSKKDFEKISNCDL